jgi:hypothetical protein
MKQRESARVEKYKRAFDCDSVDADYLFDDVARDCDATLAAIELRESITRYAIAH